MTARQYWDHPAGGKLGSALREALHFLQLAVTHLPVRVLPLVGDDRPPVVLYSDASTLNSGLRLGMVLLDPLSTAVAAVHDVPRHVIEKWKLRSTYIGQGELLCAPVALSAWRQQLQGRQVTWYVDNTSAVAAMIKGASPQVDSSPLALQAALACVHLGCRLWIEWVPSHQNLSDGLSRQGWQDKHVKAKIASGAWTRCSWSPDWNALVPGDLQTAVAQLQALQT